MNKKELKKELEQVKKSLHTIGGVVKYELSDKYKKAMGQLNDRKDKSLKSINEKLNSSNVKKDIAKNIPAKKKDTSYKGAIIGAVGATIAAGALWATKKNFEKDIDKARKLYKALEKKVVVEMNSKIKETTVNKKGNIFYGDVTILKSGASITYKFTYDISKNDLKLEFSK